MLNYVRIGYAATQLITLAIYFYASFKVTFHPSPLSGYKSNRIYLANIIPMLSQIKSKNDQTVLKFGAPPPSRMDHIVYLIGLCACVLSLV